MAYMQPSAQQYYLSFRERLKDIRAQLKWSQADMANALGIPLVTYKSYEVRSKFPPHLIERLALVTHTDVGYIVTGKAPIHRLSRRVA